MKPGIEAAEARRRLPPIETSLGRGLTSNGLRDTEEFNSGLQRALRRKEEETLTLTSHLRGQI